MRKNKKGISAIVATVLIILITVAAVTIVWAAVIPMIRDNVEGSTLCLEATQGLSIGTRDGYTCYNSTGYNITADWKSVNVQLSRASNDFDLVDVQVLVSSGGNTESTRLVEDRGETGLPDVNQEKVFTVPFYAPDGNAADSVQVAAIIGTGNTEKICEAVNIVELDEC
jgi:flagellin-like protein